MVELLILIGLLLSSPSTDRLYYDSKAIVRRKSGYEIEIKETKRKNRRSR